MITQPQDFFDRGCGRCARFDTPDCASLLWRDGLLRLRQILNSEDLLETAKWGHPCYMHADRNIAMIGALRDAFRLSFFNASLMKDPDGVLLKEGPNTQHADTLEFRTAGDVARLEPVIRSYLREAMAYAAQGIKPEKIVQVLEFSEELLAALEADPVLRDAFQALTPGRQKSYVLNLKGAKTSATRLARIARFRDKIIAGKGALDR